MLQTIAIIGAGPLGRSLALRAARAGFRVFLEDVMPSNLHHAQEFIRQQLSAEKITASLVSTCAQGVKDTSVNPLLNSGDEKGASTPARTIPVEFVSTVEDAVRSADLVIDCVPDELESKLEILWLLDRMAPPYAILATPTTALSIADLAACTYRPDKCVAIAAAPAALARLDVNFEIPLRTGPATTAETVALAAGFWRRLGFGVRESREE